MRFLLAGIMLAAWAVATPAAAQPATIGDVLACEGDSDPAMCLLRAGARDWTGDSDDAAAVMTAIARFHLHDEDLHLGADETGVFAMVRAMEEASRRDATGERATRALSPIESLALDVRREAYQMFGYGPDMFVSLSDVWRFRAASEDGVGLALRRIEEQDLARGDLSAGTIRSLASAYASQGLEEEGRSLLRRHRAENDAPEFWYGIGDFARAEQAMRALSASRGDTDVHPTMLIRVAGAAAQGGDNARAARLATELLDTFVRDRGARIIVSYDRVSLAESGARLLAASGQRDAARSYAFALMEGRAPSDALFGSHADYAIAMLTAIDDLEGACVVARTLAAAIETPAESLSGADAADEASARAHSAALALARCGDGVAARTIAARTIAARTIAARYGVDDFWLGFYLGEPLDVGNGPGVDGMAEAIEAELAAGRNARAEDLMQMLFVRQPQYAASVMHGDEPWNATLLEAWRVRGAFPALRAALLRPGRMEADALTSEERDYAFTAALMLADEP